MLRMAPNTIKNRPPHKSASLRSATTWHHPPPPDLLPIYTNVNRTFLYTTFRNPKGRFPSSASLPSDRISHDSPSDSPSVKLLTLYIQRSAPQGRFPSSADSSRARACEITPINYQLFNYQSTINHWLIGLLVHWLIGLSLGSLAHGSLAHGSMASSHGSATGSLAWSIGSLAH
jgi:hypothetical protein